MGVGIRSEVLESGGKLLNAVDDPRGDVLNAGEVELVRPTGVLELNYERLNELGGTNDALHQSERRQRRVGGASE